MAPYCEKLISTKVPFVYFGKRPEADMVENNMEKKVNETLVRRTYEIFIGLEDADDATRSALLDFSMHMAGMNVDSAYKSLQNITNKAVWMSLARMCVITERLDMVMLCLGKMQNAMAARAVQQSMLKEKQPKLHLAELAVQLEMISCQFCVCLLKDHAVKLLTECQRYDVLNRLYQARNDWTKAIEIAEKYDRIHLKNTYYAYAKHLQSSEEWEAAVEYNDRNLLHWWARYLESLGDIKAAKKYYQKVEDTQSVVRLLCHIEEHDTAMKVAMDTKNKAACFYLAQYYENANQKETSLKFYTLAESYGNAIRICKEVGMVDEITQLAMLGTKKDMIDAAKFYEEEGLHVDQAVMLYHKAGMFAKALDLAFSTGELSALNLIAVEVNDKMDPAILKRFAEFFIQNHQYLKAVQALANARQAYNTQRIEIICLNLTTLSEFLPHAATRNELLKKLADYCTQQGQYYNAAKKYIQSGNEILGMKALLRSGDKDKIVFFANTARSREIYIMAANYLQTLNWKAHPDIMNNIVLFYKRGRAMDLLASFYKFNTQRHQPHYELFFTWGLAMALAPSHNNALVHAAHMSNAANIEIEECQNYEHAMSALYQALEYLEKSGEASASDNTRVLRQEIHGRISTIKKFTDLKKLLETNRSEAIVRLVDMTGTKGEETTVKVRDIYALLINDCLRNNESEKVKSTCKLSTFYATDLINWFVPGLMQRRNEACFLTFKATVK
ncbi:unnamed protein product [Soboliphyme baturini]|uniref:Intraflagellar transport protein 140 homolog n=1 Tax=Soboliphyme baturini TaxID=241478 RepID=A0A183IX20_9BILA|nr:unnamed protein product [Soboliphyme baturini]